MAWRPFSAWRDSFESSKGWRTKKTFPPHFLVQYLLSVVMPFLGRLVCLMVLCLAVSCSKDPAATASDSDANGYACKQCAEKFYTARSVFADVCPKCKSPDVIEVVGFVCEKDKHVTLTPRGAQMMACEKCQQPVRSIKLPRENELMQWGAKKQSKAQVTAQ
jgi:hypothetical protein